MVRVDSKEAGDAQIQLQTTGGNLDNFKYVFVLCSHRFGCWDLQSNNKLSLTVQTNP